jgi:hypothetical protein
MLELAPRTRCSSPDAAEEAAGTCACGGRAAPEEDGAGRARASTTAWELVSSWLSTCTACTAQRQAWPSAALWW